MNDIRRTILWVAFGMSLVMLWDAWQVHNGKKATFFPAPQASSAKAASSAAGAASAALPLQAAASAAAGVPVSAASAPALPKTASAPATAVPAGQSPAAAAQSGSAKIVVTTDVLRLTLDTAGGSVVKAELLKHVDNAAGVKGTGGPVAILDSSAERAYVAQTGLIGAVGLPTHLSPMRFAGDKTLAAGQESLSFSFESEEAGGAKLIKRYTLKRGAYVAELSHEVKNASAAAISPQLYLQLVRDGNKPAGESPFYSTFTGPAYYTLEKKFQKVDFSDIEKKKVEPPKSGSDGYVAMVQHYFASAWLLKDGVAREFFANKVSANLYSAGMITALGQIAPGETKSVESRLFIGPQEEKQLEKLYPGLELVKDYGWLTLLAKPLYWLLDQIYQILGNWGWSIVGLVVLLKAAFYWLNASAYRSMAKMKAVNPKVMEVRERLKDKPQEMQQAMMKIYREEKVNPMGGCFPIMIQIPVFIALYWVLLSTVEVRNAPWILWIKDLAAPDPFFILPFLMTGTTMLQTWLNPTPPDPLQAKLMWILPLVFSVMFFFFPAGLVLYWLTNNILSIAQQWFINKRLGVLGK